MKNNYYLCESTGQSAEPAAVILAWDIQGKCERNCLIDAADLPIADSIPGTWYANRSKSAKENWYVQAKVWVPGIGGRTIMLHRLLLGSPDTEVDHKDGDGLNNQRYNLHGCSHQENMRYRYPNRDWPAVDEARALADEYRTERTVARQVQEQFGLTRQALFAIRTGRTLTSPGARAYLAGIAGLCRTYAELKQAHPTTGAKFGVHSSGVK